MTDAAKGYEASPARSIFSTYSSSTLLVLVLLFLVVGVNLFLTNTFINLKPDDALLTDSTPGELAVWMADQSKDAAPESFLGQYAKDWAAQIGEESLPPEVLLVAMRNGMAAWAGLGVLLSLVSILAIITGLPWGRAALLALALIMNTMLFLVPTMDGDPTQAVLLAGIAMVLVALLFAPGKVTRVLGFFVVLTALLVAWETGKAFSKSIGYKVTLPQGEWSHTTYPTLDDALVALGQGEIVAVFADRKELNTLMPPYPVPEDADTSGLAYPDLRYLGNLDGSDRILGLPMKPNYPGRLAVAVRADGADQWTAIGQFHGQAVGAVADSYADTNYLSQPRALVLLDLKILNDLNLPHLQSIAEAALQPARRNGPALLVRILAEEGGYTWGEALYGFLFGASLGFVLGTLFAHSGIMERGLLPYVVASQTVPILAIAPMVVIWLGAGPLAVSVIAAYLTFFPVTINTLRGLESPNPTAVELMQSYAASKWTIMWKLRFPAALPFIFTALKVSATASVVGAIIGELPSSIHEGLGRAILDFSSDYSLISTPKLWAAIAMAAFIGIIFFVAVSVLEMVLLRGQVREM